MDKKNLNLPVTVTLFNQDKHCGGWIPGNLGDAIAWLQNFLEKVPAEYRDSAWIEISSYDDYGSSIVDIEISYKRPPTEADKQQRLNEERERFEEVDARERLAYERLKKKYEVKTPKNA